MLGLGLGPGLKAKLFSLGIEALSLALQLAALTLAIPPKTPWPSLMDPDSPIRGANTPLPSPLSS